METEEGKTELALLRQSVEKWKLPSPLAAGLSAAADAAAGGVSAVVGVPAGLAYMALRGGNPSDSSASAAQSITYDSTGELEVVTHEGLLPLYRPIFVLEPAH